MNPRSLLTLYAGYLVLSGLFMWVAGDLAAADLSEVTEGMSRTEVFQRIVGTVMLGSAAPIWVLRDLEGPLMGSLLGAAAVLNGVMTAGALLLLEGSGMTTAPVALVHGAIALVFVAAWRRQKADLRGHGPVDAAVE